MIDLYCYSMDFNNYNFLYVVYNLEIIRLCEK